jgi:hypothetical protein
VVTNCRVRDVSTPVPSQTRPVRQIHVFVGRKELIVESSELVEDRLRHQTRSSAHPEYFCRGPCPIGGLPVMPFERTAPSQQAVTGAVNDAGVVHVHNSRCHKRKTSAQFDASSQRTKPGRFGDCIVVEKRDVLTAGLLRARIVATSESAILGESDHADVRKPSAHELGAPIGRPIVDDNDLGAYTLLRLSGAQAGVQVLAAIPRDDDNRHLRTKVLGWRLQTPVQSREVDPSGHDAAFIV